MTTTMTMPETPEQLRELLADGNKLKAAFADLDTAMEFITGYAQKAMKRDPDLKAQLKEQVQLGIAEYMAQTTGQKAPVDYAGIKAIKRAQGLNTSAHRALYNPDAMGARADGIFASGGEFFNAIAPNAHRHPNARDLSAKLDRLREIQNSYGSEAPSAGGFLIPEEFRSQIMEIGLEQSVTRSRATVIPMSSLTIPIPFIDDISHANSVMGGVICYWEEEGGLLTESQASFGAAELHARKLTAFAAIPQELLDDAPAFTGFFDATFPKAMAWFEDLGYISGTGVGQPTGWQNCPATVFTALDAGQSGTHTITWTNVLNMMSRLLPTSWGNAVWVINIDCFMEVMTMSLPVGTGGSAVMMGQGLNQPGSQRAPMTLLGIPIVWTEKVPALGTTGDISLVDLSYYLIGDRMQMQTANSDQYLFQNNKMAFRAIQRLDGRPWLSQPLTPHSDSTNTLSAFVQLTAR